MAGEKNQRAVESDVNLSKGTELNKKFSPEEKHLKKCSTCLFIREMQIKMALRFHFTQVRSKTHKTAGAGKNVEKEEHSSPAGGIASWYNHSGNQFGSSSENWA